MKFVRKVLLAAVATLVLVCLWGLAAAQEDHDHSHAPPARNPLGELARKETGALIVQDFQGRMKPLDTLAREMVVKITKRPNFAGWEPLDLYLSWLANPQHWFEQPLLYVRHPDLKQQLGVSASTTHVSAASLIDADGQYALSALVEETLRTPDKNRSKMQRRLLSFDERFNLFYMTLQGRTLRLYPIPGDENNTWTDIRNVTERLSAEQADRFQAAFRPILTGVRDLNREELLSGVRATAAIQAEFGSEVLPGQTALRSELLLNSTSPFRRVIFPYMIGFLVLMIAFAWTLVRRGGAPYFWRHPLYLVGSLIFWGSLLIHLAGFVLRWVASGRAPLSNGYESLVFISLCVALAGLIFESKDRRGSAAGLASLLAGTVLGISMMSAFDPAIGPLVPVLASYWLNIHVTVITSSYGFFGLGALLGGLILVLHFFKGPGRSALRQTVLKLDRLLFNVLVTGIALLSVGTLLGGVWANESWGRYWGWDPKETWSLVSILIYAAVLHFRWIPALNRPWVLASGSFLSIASIIMTYFGVNYFLVGLHSYAQGEAARVPTWVWLGSAVMLLLVLASGWFDRHRSWGVSPEQTPQEAPEPPERVPA